MNDAARLELVTVLDRIKDMEPDDTAAVPVWRRLYALAPKVYAATKTVRDRLMSEAVRRLLDKYLP